MIDWKLIFLGYILPTAIGVGATVLVGRTTNDLIRKVVNPIQATVINMSNAVRPLSADIHALKEAVDQLANPLKEVANALKDVIGEIGTRR